jgi:succinate dehydrogenase / fumarate reductase, membrane anchor subunit
MSDMNTPLAKVRGLGSAKTGTHHWWMQRVSAVANIPLVIWFVVSMLGHVQSDFATLFSWMQVPFVAVLMILLIANMSYHMNLGLQIAIEDYVHGRARIVSMLVLDFATVVLAVLGIFSVLKISVGG